MDRVGGGDSFASGLVYGLMTFEDAEKAVNYGAAHGALAAFNISSSYYCTICQSSANISA